MEAEAAAAEPSAAADLAAGGLQDPGAHSDALCESLMGLLAPMVSKCDEGVQAALNSQAVLSAQIDRVALELQRFLSSSQLPSLSPYAQKLADMRRRVADANGTLVRVQERLGRVQARATHLLEEEKLALAVSNAAIAQQ